MDQTVVGYAPPAAEARFRGTMIGIAPPSPPQSTAPTPHSVPAPAPGGLRQTMIGIAPLSAAPPASPSVSSMPAAPAPDKYPTPPPPPEVPAAPLRTSTAGGTLPYIESHQKTMLGVARPGIAPLNPTQAKAPTAPPVTPRLASHGPGGTQAAPLPLIAPTPASRGVPVARPLAPAVLTSRNEPAAAKLAIPPLAAIAIIGAGALFAAAAVVWLFYRGQGAIEARASAATDGKEQLELSCAACDDGTRVKLDAAQATFKERRAALPLARPLKVGENPMTLSLTSPSGKQSFVDISVPIAFRVRGDTSGLDAPVPELRVLVSALAGSTVSVDGKAVTLNADGDGRYAIDVSAEVTGLDAAVKTLERRIPYVVTPPSSAPQSGTVTLQAGITPLVIDAPGSAVVLDTSNFVLAGRTAKAGALTVSDRPITVDPSGRFAQMMNVSATGETTITIRATSKDTAPRLFPLRVKRVDSLQREGERVRQRATSNYAAISDQAEAKRGWAVALDGSVVDARTENYNTVIVMDVTGGCAHAPCLARISYGAPFSVARGEKLSAFGEVAGVVDGPRSGTRIPDIRADFLIKVGK